VFHCNSHPSKSTVPGLECSKEHSQPKDGGGDIKESRSKGRGEAEMKEEEEEEGKRKASSGGEESPADAVLSFVSSVMRGL